MQHAQGLQKKLNMASIKRSFYLLNASAICTIFPHNLREYFDDFNLLREIYLRKGNDAKNSAIRNLLEILFEICPFLPILVQSKPSWRVSMKYIKT